jgi:hypothetical protein
MNARLHAAAGVGVRVICGREIVALLLAVLLAACAGAPPKAAPPLSTKVSPNASASAAAAASSIVAATGDWRELIPAPFGSVLTNVQLPLREVLLFRDEPRGAAEAEEQECHAKSGSPFMFAGHPTADYVLCFSEERLYRIEVAQRWNSREPAAEFSSMCDRWLKGLSDMERDATRCHGHEGNTEFSARRIDPASRDELALEIFIYNVPAREAFERRVKERMDAASADKTAEPPAE